MSKGLSHIGSLLKHNPMAVWIMEGKSVMTVLGIPGDSRDYQLLRSLPAHDQRKRGVKQGSVQPDGVPTYKVYRVI